MMNNGAKVRIPVARAGIRKYGIKSRQITQEMTGLVVELPDEILILAKISGVFSPSPTPLPWITQASSP